MKNLFAVSVIASLAAVAGCATSGMGLPGRDGHSPGGVRPPGIPTTDVLHGDAGMPERISRAELPSVERLSRRIVHEHRGVISAQVRLCVSPDGAVAGVEQQPAAAGERDQDEGDDRERGTEVAKHGARVARRSHRPVVTPR